jgi:3-carboxy-cis,cis-muconate cycloisomerase
VTGRLLDATGRPVAAQRVEIWQANVAGRYNPQKRNPVLSILIRRAAMSGPPLAATLHTAAALANDERPDGSWHAEWETLRLLARRTVVAGSRCGELLGGLEVHSAQTAKNLDSADVLGEQRVVAELVGKTPSGSYFGVVDALIDESIDRAKRIVKERP